VGWGWSCDASGGASFSAGMNGGDERQPAVKVLRDSVAPEAGNRE